MRPGNTNWRRSGCATHSDAAGLRSIARCSNLAVSLARRLKDTGVTSNIVAPGAILVPSVRELLEKVASERGWGDSWDEIERSSVNEIVPNDVGQFGRPEEVAGSVTYLASGYADYISGATIGSTAAQFGRRSRSGSTSFDSLRYFARSCGPPMSSPT